MSAVRRPRARPVLLYRYVSSRKATMSDRRAFLRMAGGIMAAGSGILLPDWALARKDELGPAGLPAGAREASMLDTLPGKQPLIKRTFRAPNYETPVEHFNEL